MLAICFAACRVSVATDACTAPVKETPTDGRAMLQVSEGSLQGRKVHSHAHNHDAQEASPQAPWEEDEEVDLTPSGEQVAQLIGHTSGSSASRRRRQIEGYVVRDGKSGCSGRNEDGTSSLPNNDVESCAALCSSSPSCISFEYRSSDRKCQRSQTCDFLKSTGTSSSWVYYSKKMDAMLSFEQKPGSSGCSGRNELPTKTGKTLEQCAQLCLSDSSCISFELSAMAKCQRSTSCTKSRATGTSSDWYYFYRLPTTTTTTSTTTTTTTTTTTITTTITTTTTEATTTMTTAEPAPQSGWADAGFTKVGMGVCLGSDYHNSTSISLGWSPCTCSGGDCSAGACPSLQACFNDCAANSDCGAFGWYDKHCWMFGGYASALRYTKTDDTKFNYFECYVRYK